VHFVGFVEEVAEAVAGMDVMVHATIDQEAFGRVVVEAMACGVPVVASSIDGVPEILLHGETGLLFQRGDIRQMAGTVERILDDESLRRRLCNHARRVVASRFTLAQHRQAIVQCYEELFNFGALRSPLEHGRSAGTSCSG
jgi:glycosyltransferase involved in cell wall biosynthesis